MATAGFLGSFTLRGDLQPLVPFLVAGTVCNAGKGAAAGFGRYRLTPE
jgi:predicted Kef-type K+ transport protein